MTPLGEGQRADRGAADEGQLHGGPDAREVLLDRQAVRCAPGSGRRRTARARGRCRRRAANQPSEASFSQPYLITAEPMRPKVPSGAMRMIHHSTRWMTFSSDSVKTRKGSAFLPALSAAMPMTAATTMTWRMLKPTLDENVPSAAPGEVLTVRPRKFCGIRPSRKFHQVPTVYARRSRGPRRRGCPAGSRDPARCR